MPLSQIRPTHAEYIEHVRLMRAWLHPLECWLDDSTHFQTALIDADLADAGIHPEAEQTGMRMRRWPTEAHASYRWGARYVIEGSRLGAAVLYRRLRYALRPYQLHYLHGGDAAFPNRWPEFLRDLSDAVQTPAEIAEACQGACESFDALLAAVEVRV